MAKFLAGIFLAISLFIPQAFSSDSPVDPKLIKKVKAKVDSFTEKGNEKALELWVPVLDALSGKYEDNESNLFVATLMAHHKMTTTKKKKQRKLWGKITDALYATLDSQLLEKEYDDLDSDLVAVLKDMLSSTEKREEKQPWRHVLMVLSGTVNDSARSVVMALEHYVSVTGQRPSRWDELIDGLEQYALERSYGEKPFIYDVRANSSYSYDIYDAETGEKIGSVDAMDHPAAEMIGPIESRLKGRYNTNQGMTKWALKKIGSEDTDYLSYGYWAHSRVPVGRENDNFNERQMVAFFHGDNPATDISHIRGSAYYKGKTVGVWKYNLPKEPEINGFKGDVALVVSFEKDTIRGNITNLEHDFNNRNNPEDSILPVQIHLGTADLSPNGQFSGRTSFGNNENNGEWNGRFYNQESQTDAPGQVGGSYSVVTGLKEKDMQIQGAFGASLGDHSEGYRVDDPYNWIVGE